MFSARLDLDSPSRDEERRERRRANDKRGDDPICRLVEVLANRDPRDDVDAYQADKRRREPRYEKQAATVEAMRQGEHESKPDQERERVPTVDDGS